MSAQALCAKLVRVLLATANNTYRSGLGGIELFSMGLKASGTYLSRTLSYKDAEFRLEQIDIDPAFRWAFPVCTHTLTCWLVMNTCHVDVADLTSHHLQMKQL